MSKYLNKPLLLLCIMGLISLIQPVVAMEAFLMRLEIETKEDQKKYSPCKGYVHSSCSSKFCKEHKGLERYGYLEARLNSIRVSLKWLEEGKIDLKQPKSWITFYNFIQFVSTQELNWYSSCNSRTVHSSCSNKLCKEHKGRKRCNELEERINISKQKREELEKK